ncbi:MAG: hypothetical protein ABSD49_07940 [Candidatus Bathyarchaeia archaeon]
MLSKKQDLAARFLILVAIGEGLNLGGSSMLGIPLSILGWTVLGSWIVLSAGVIIWLFRNKPWFYQEPDLVDVTPV